MLTQLGFCAVYLVFVSSTIVEVAEWENKVDKRLIIIILAVPIIFLSWIRSLEKLAYLSVAANILCVGGLITVYQFLIRNLHDPTELPSFAGPENLPMFFAMALFSFEGIGVVSSILRFIFLILLVAILSLENLFAIILLKIKNVFR